jgi:acyl-CoA thioester hydrolase
MAPFVSTSVRLRVPYYDVDLMQVVWNGNYLKYFEVARQALFNECGLDLRRCLEEQRYVFPVIRSAIKQLPFKAGRRVQLHGDSQGSPG